MRYIFIITLFIFVGCKSKKTGTAMNDVDDIQRLLNENIRTGTSDYAHNIRLDSTAYIAYADAFDQTTARYEAQAQGERYFGWARWDCIRIDSITHVEVDLSQIAYDSFLKIENISDSTYNAALDSTSKRAALD